MFVSTFRIFLRVMEPVWEKGGKNNEGIRVKSGIARGLFFEAFLSAAA